MLKLVRYFNCAAFFGFVISVSAVAQELPANATMGLSLEGRPGVAREVHPQASNESAALQSEGGAGPHVRSNLAAQEAAAEATKQIASATWWQVGLAVFGTVAAVAGAIAVIWNLRLVREANSILHADQRAWLSIDILRAAEVFSQKDMFVLNAYAKIENFGRSPAIGVRVHFELFKINFDDTPEGPLSSFVERCIAEYRADRNTFTFAVFPSGVHQMDRPKTVTTRVRHSPSGETEGIFALNCCVLYRSGLGKEILHTGAVFTILPKRGALFARSNDSEEFTYSERSVEVRPAGIRAMS